jgi:hypothetical protein
MFNFDEFPANLGPGRGLGCIWLRAGSEKGSPLVARWIAPTTDPSQKHELPDSAEETDPPEATAILHPAPARGEARAGRLSEPGAVTHAPGLLPAGGSAAGGTRANAARTCARPRYQKTA